MVPNRRFTTSARNLLTSLERQVKYLRLQEDFRNINRMKPVRLNVAGSAQPPQAQPKLTPKAIEPGFVSVPTEAEMDYYTMGLQLPDKVENLEKLLADMQRTGKFDYELCYLLRKQEAIDELEDWMKQVLHKRREGDVGFGKDTDANRFSKLYEAIEQKVTGRNLFADRFTEELQRN